MDFDYDNLKDPYTAEQYEWLKNWWKLECTETNNMDSLRKKHIEEILKLQIQVKDQEIENQGLRQQIDGLFYELQFVCSQKDQLAVEKETIALKLKEEEAIHRGVVEKLEEQVHSMQIILRDLEDQIAEKENMRQNLLKNLENQEQIHLKEMDQLKLNLENKNQDDITCPICLVAWDVSGSHGLVSLSCGHLFGDSCIRSYLNRSGECPICRKPCDYTHLRYIYGRHILPNQ